MTTLNEGRNEIRIENSKAKCLMENWVEEVLKTETFLFQINIIK